MIVEVSLRETNRVRFLATKNTKSHKKKTPDHNRSLCFLVFFVAQNRIATLSKSLSERRIKSDLQPPRTQKENVSIQPLFVFSCVLRGPKPHRNFVEVSLRETNRVRSSATKNTKRHKRKTFQYNRSLCFFVFFVAQNRIATLLTAPTTKMNPSPLEEKLSFRDRRRNDSI